MNQPLHIHTYFKLRYVLSQFCSVCLFFVPQSYIYFFRLDLVENTATWVIFLVNRIYDLQNSERLSTKFMVIWQFDISYFFFFLPGYPKPLQFWSAVCAKLKWPGYGCMATSSPGNLARIFDPSPHHCKGAFWWNFVWWIYLFHYF